MDSKPPVFIVGVPRSGTTLLATLLERHPELYVDDEAIALRALLLKKHLETTDLPAAVRAEIDRDARLARFYADNPDGDTPAATYLRRQLDRLAAGKTYVDKSPDALPEAARLAGLFPGSRFITVVRDPRPTVSSLCRRQYLELHEAALLWRDWNEMTTGFRRWWPAGTLLQIRYEDLVLTPEACLRDVCAFLGLDFRPEMLNLADSAATRGPNAYVKSEVDTKLVTAWRKKMSLREQQIIEDICRPRMEALGYEVASPGKPATTPGYWKLYRHQVAHKFRLLGQPTRKHMAGRRLHDRPVTLVSRLGAVGKAILRGFVREDLLGKSTRK